jgi:hypothetical protein
MSTLAITIILAFVIVALALASLAIGWLLTGKSRIVRGACGMDPKKLKDGSCGTADIHCALCDPKDEKKTTKDDGDHS